MILLKKKMDNCSSKPFCFSVRFCFSLEKATHTQTSEKWKAKIRKERKKKLPVKKKLPSKRVEWWRGGEAATLVFFCIFLLVSLVITQEQQGSIPVPDSLFSFFFFFLFWFVVVNWVIQSQQNSDLSLTKQNSYCFRFVDFVLVCRKWEIILFKNSFLNPLDTLECLCFMICGLMIVVTFVSPFFPLSVISFFRFEIGTEKNYWIGLTTVLWRYFRTFFLAIFVFSLGTKKNPKKEFHQ